MNFTNNVKRQKKQQKKNYWHTNKLSLEERKKIREKYNSFLIEYSSRNKNNLYIIEGIDIYNAISPQKIKDKGIIIKGTSGLKCFFRRYRRDKNTDNQSNLKNKFMYLKMVINESKIFYFRDRKRLNKLIHLIKY